MSEYLQKQTELETRLIKLTSRVDHLTQALPKTLLNINASRQVTRSVSSIGANYKEACGSESDDDFIHKLSICLKEAQETEYWVKVVYMANPELQPRLEGLLIEIHEIIKIFSKAISTTRKKKKNNV